MSRIRVVKQSTPPGEAARRRILSFAATNAHLALPPTLPAVTHVSHDLTDLDLGLPTDPIAQEIAERLIRAAIAYRMKAEENKLAIAIIRDKSLSSLIEIALPADSFDIDPEDLNDVLGEIERTSDSPGNRWMAEAPPIQ